MKNILVTAIGSMSGSCTIESLKNLGHKVYGCDIYPKEWLSNAEKCANFDQVPLVCKEILFFDKVKDICRKYNITLILPLTDVEVDFFNKYREYFDLKGITICIPNQETLHFSRNKYNLSKIGFNDTLIRVPKTIDAKEFTKGMLQLPMIAKPKNGRSSEGIIIVSKESEINSLPNINNYIIQEYIQGSVFTVDFVRNPDSGNSFAIAREELIRTKNGAGITVKITKDDKLKSIVDTIGKLLDIKGCVNIEFIKKNDQFFLIDINPRFSAGVAYSNLVGYDMVKNCLNVHLGKDIDPPINYKEYIVSKDYYEKIIL